MALKTTAVLNSVVRAVGCIVPKWSVIEILFLQVNTVIIWPKSRQKMYFPRELKNAGFRQFLKPLSAKHGHRVQTTVNGFTTDACQEEFLTLQSLL